MALDSQTVNFPMMKGINTKVDSKQIALGEMSILENAIFQTIQKFRKRNGYSALSTSVLTLPPTLEYPKATTTITNGSFCGSFKNEQLMGDGFSLYSYSDADDKWSYKGRCKSARIGVSSRFNNSNNNIKADSAYNLTTGMSVFAWILSTSPAPGVNEFGVVYAVYDTASDQQLFNGNLATTTTRPKCISIGNNLYITYYDSADFSLKARIAGSSGVGPEIVLATDINKTFPNYDILVNNSLVYVAYNTEVSGVTITSFDASLVQQATVVKAEVASNGVGIFTDTTNNIWCAYNNSTETKAFIMNGALTVTVLAPTIVDSNAATATYVRNVTGVYDGTRGVIFYDQPQLRVLGPDTGINLTQAFNQPAVGNQTTVTVSGAGLPQSVGQFIFIENAGYYYVNGGGSGAISIVNTGEQGNVAPGVAVTQPQNIFYATVFSNARINFNTLTAAGTAGAVAVFARSVGLASRAFQYGNVPSVLTCHDSVTEPTYFLAHLYDYNSAKSNVPVAHFSCRIASNIAGGLSNVSILPAMNLISAGKYKCAIAERSFNIIKTDNNVATAYFFNGVSSVDIDLAPTQVSKQDIANGLHIASGSLMLYDGVTIAEHGFHMYPEPIKCEESGAGNIAAGNYSYVALYAWMDAQGQIHRSAPSQIFNITTSGGTDAVVVTIPTLRVTQKDFVTIEVYRTTNNGTLFYRIDTNYISNLVNFPVINLTATDTILFTDTFSDAEIIGNQQLYTTGEVENIVSPAPQSLAVFKNRLLVVPSDDTSTEFYSKQVIPGSPVELSDSFVQNTEQTSGGIIGSAQLDDKWIIWKGSNIFYIVGSGPAPSGSNNDFSDPTLIATDVGLVDPASIIVMPFGAMFKSSKGVYLLDRSLAVQPIGAKVQAYNAFSVISARLAAEVNQVRFILSNGQAIVYDYFVNEWAVFTNYAGIDSMVSQGVYYFLKADGTVMKETAGLYSDNGSFISMKVRTGWLQFAGVQGFQRVWRCLILGEYFSAHNLQVQVAVDFDATIVQTTTYAPGALIPYQWQLNLARQKTEAIQITIQDLDTGTDGESYSLSNLAFEAGVKRGLNKMGATQAG